MMTQITPERASGTRLAAWIATLEEAARLCRLRARETTSNHYAATLERKASDLEEVAERMRRFYGRANPG